MMNDSKNKSFTESYRGTRERASGCCSVAIEVNSSFPRSTQTLSATAPTGVQEEHPRQLRGPGVETFPGLRPKAARCFASQLLSVAE